MTTPNAITSLLAAALMATGFCLSCSDESGGSPVDGGDDAGADTDGDTDTDADSDADTDTDTDTGTDTGTAPLIPVDISVLTFNVGNPDADDPYYPLRLKSQDYEDHMAGVIQALAPDIVVLQEVLSGKTCEAFTETDPEQTCYEWDTRPRPAERLLGPDYSIVCDEREQVECIGVHTGLGPIVGLPLGGYDETGAETPDLPLPPCIWADDECTDSLCDAESTVSAVTVDTQAGPLRIAHMHPMAQVSATISGDQCRALQLAQVFEGAVMGTEPALLDGYERSIIAGDWNLGLEVYWARTLFSTDDSAQVWDDNINCSGCYYEDVDPRDGSQTRYSTTSVAPSFLSSLGLPIAIDHVVVSEGIAGSCTIYDDGGQPGTDPLDDSYPNLGSLGNDERIDHYGIMCDLTVQPVETSQ